MVRYIPGAILALFGVLAYAIGCALFLAYRRQRAADPGKNTSLRIYAIVMIVLGFLAFGAGLYALEIAEYHALGH